MSIEEIRKAFEEATKGMSIGPYFWSSKTNEYTIVPTQRNFEVWQAAKAYEAKKLEGCLVVPVEPTKAVIDAMEQFDCRYDYADMQAAYKAALEAARGGNE